MAKVTEVLASTTGPVFISDFTPPRGSGREFVEDARDIDADFICIAYNPGKAVRVDSATAAYAIKQDAGLDAVFNLSPRDMNKLALQSHLLGADLLGLDNVLVVQGDPVTERDTFAPVQEYTASGLVQAIGELNAGIDFKGSKLRNPTDFCIGAGIDLGRGLKNEARLTHRKVQAGAHFFVSQPVFDPGQITEFQLAFAEVAGTPLTAPVFWGLQILVAGGVLFSTVPADLRSDLEAGRDGVDIALETYALLRESGVRTVYLVPPILRGGARDYAAASRFLTEARALSSELPPA